MSSGRVRILLVALLVSPLALLLSCTSSGTGLSSAPVAPAVPGPAPSTMWVAGWGNSPENGTESTSNPGGQEQSFRSFFYPTVSGTEERVHLSNYFGTTPLTVGSARLSVATGSGAAIDPSHDAPLTFGGNESVTIPAGQSVVSDAVNITYSFGQKMAVSVYLSGTFPALTQHDSQVITNYETPAGAGDATVDSSGASFSVANTEWFLVSGMDVYGSYQGTVVLFGSSSIDGHASNYGDTSSYPTPNAPIASQDNDRPSDWLARELNSAGYRVGVLNAGVLGDPAGDAAATPGGQASGVTRMNRDVLQQASVNTVIIYLGSIDLRSGACLDAPEVEDALTNMAAQADAVGVRVVLATLPPSSYCSTQSSANYGPLPTTDDPYAGDINPGPENPGDTQRRLVNTWIKTTGAALPGVVAIADFDSVLAYSAHPDFMIPNLNSGDNYHPNGSGYGMQSSAISLTSLLAQ